MNKLLKQFLVILISVFVVSAIAYAGSLTPTSTPTATSYTLGDIYTRLTTNATATEADHDLTDSTTPAASFYTLTEIYDSIPTISASKVLTGTSYLGVAGTVFENQYNGSATSGATDYTFYTQANGGVDDYNDGQSSLPAESYQGSWIDCVAGNDYCGTGDSNADAKDNQTNLIWSTPLDADTWWGANNCYEPETAENPGTCSVHGNDACQCVKKTSSKTGCEALGDGEWRMSHQKELLQAYINGVSKSSTSYLSDTGYWHVSSTTLSYATQNVWYVDLRHGATSFIAKTNDSSCRLRCVRSAE